MPTAKLERGVTRALMIAGHHDARLDAVERALAARGCATDFCTDGITGLARAREIRPAIVICQVLLPGLDGLSVCRAIKRDPATRDIKVVLLSVLAAADRAREAGADGFLGEPMTEDGLLRVVEDLLQPQTSAAPPA